MLTSQELDFILMTTDYFGPTWGIVDAEGRAHL